MILTAQVRAEKRGVIPSVTHVDGSARPQTVEKEINPLYYRLIDEFGRRTGVPVVMNTSFNLRGEAIVHTPTDAIRTFSVLAWMPCSSEVSFWRNKMAELTSRLLENPARNQFTNARLDLKGVWLMPVTVSFPRVNTNSQFASHGYPCQNLNGSYVLPSLQ